MSNVMKYISMLAMALLVGCNSDIDTKNKSDTGYEYMEIACINGVQYYKALRLMAVAYNADGSIKECTEITIKFK